MKREWYADLTENQLKQLCCDTKARQAMAFFKAPAYRYTSLKGGEHGISDTGSTVYRNDSATSSESV